MKKAISKALKEPQAKKAHSTSPLTIGGLN